MTPCFDGRCCPPNQKIGVCSWGIVYLTVITLLNFSRNGSVILNVSVEHEKDSHKLSLQRYVVDCLTKSRSMKDAGLDWHFLKEQFPPEAFDGVDTSPNTHTTTINYMNEDTTADFMLNTSMTALMKTRTSADLPATSSNFQLTTQELDPTMEATTPRLTVEECVDDFSKLLIVMKIRSK